MPIPSERNGRLCLYIITSNKFFKLIKWKAQQRLNKMKMAINFISLFQKKAATSITR